MGNKALKIVFATGNHHKLSEINEIAKCSEIEFVLPPEGFNPKENGTTFCENSYIKALKAAKLSNNIALADDSGLCVEALNGEPGIYSARYAPTAQERIDKLLYNLADKANRNAKFVCAMTLVNSSGEILSQEIGECFGKISKTQSGTNGFGYDPVFIPDGYNITIADMSEDLKNKISHRSVALNKILKYITKNLI
jgi:XTP/dITP diphosphohydrolase